MNMTTAEALEILRGLHSRCDCAGQRVVQDAVQIAVDSIVEGERLRARVAELEAAAALEARNTWRVSYGGRIHETHIEREAREAIKLGYKVWRLYSHEVNEWRGET